MLSFDQAADIIKGSVFHSTEAVVTHFLLDNQSEETIMAAIDRLKKQPDKLYRDFELCAALAAVYLTNFTLGEKEPWEAEKLASKAAVGGNPLGQAILGLVYLPGDNPLEICAYDYKKSAAWLLKAAIQGSGLALGHLLSVREALNSRTNERTLIQGFNREAAYVRQGGRIIGTRNTQQIVEDLKLLEEINAALAVIYANKTDRNAAAALKREEPA